MPITKHLQLRIDFDITIADTPPLLPEGTIDPPDLDYDARQARLLEAVKGNHAVLTYWLHNLIANAMHVYPPKNWYELLTGGEAPFYAMLAPVLITLSAEDQEYFDEVNMLDVFEDCIDMFMQSFTIEEHKPVIRDPEWGNARMQDLQAVK